MNGFQGQEIEGGWEEKRRKLVRQILIDHSRLCRHGNEVFWCVSSFHHKFFLFHVNIQQKFKFLFDSFSIAHEIWRQLILKYFNLSGDADFSAKAHTHTPTEVFSQTTIGMCYISLEKCSGRRCLLALLTQSVCTKYICCHSTNMQLISDDGLLSHKNKHFMLLLQTQLCYFLRVQDRGARG